MSPIKNQMREKETKKGMKTFLQDTRAISEALGFVLIIAIVLSATSIYISQQVPILTEDYEARHADEVVDDFSELDSLVDGIVLVAKQEGETPAATSKSIKMSPDRVPLFGMSPPGASLSFSPQGEEFFAILPYVGNGSPPAGSQVNDSIEESTTADFSHPNATSVHVDVSFDAIKLSRVAHSGDRIINDTIYTMSGEFHYGTLSITNNSKVYIIPGNYLKLYANTIFIDATSSIIADDRGYFGGDSGKIGNGPGFGNREGPAYNGSGGGGAGYAGEGGDGGLGGFSIEVGDIGRGGSDYGDNGLLSFDLGSGGGGGAYGDGGQGAAFDGPAGGDGGSGGGGVLMEAPLIRIAGTISANGFSGLDGSKTGSGGKAGGGGGGGSGGAITICGYEMNLSSATFSAQGGDGGDGGTYTGPGAGGGGGGGGAGGRIKIFYDNVSRYDNASLSHFENGGSGGSGYDAGNGENGPDGIFNETETMYISTVPHESSGYYNSSVYDTGYTTTCYGTISWIANTSAYTSLVIKVRTSISPNMTGAALWENCPAVANGQDISELSSAFDRHRYIQYRADLLTYEPATTPVLDWVRINYSSHCLAGEGGGGIVDSATGDIKFRSGYIYYPNQEVVYEHGAVIRAQTVGDEKRGFVISDPPITIGTTIVDNVTVPLLQISMVDLTGSNYSYAGSKSSSVETSSTDYAHLAGTIAFDNLSLTMTTAYPLIWSNWFNQTLGESGLDASYYSPPISNESAGTVVVEFYGQGGGVYIYEEKTTIAVDIKT